MGLINKLFDRDKGKIECPRCLGKGHVDWDDIKRLNQQLKWKPGKCAYCDGIGKINSKLLSKVSVDNSYLTTDLTKDEKMRLLDKDEGALKRAKENDNQRNNFIKQISFLHFKGGMNSTLIAEFYLIPNEDSENNSGSPEQEKVDLIEYIDSVIEINRNKN
jgi:hypothetical protein